VNFFVLRIDFLLVFRVCASSYEVVGTSLDFKFLVYSDGMREDTSDWLGGISALGWDPYGKVAMYAPHQPTILPRRSRTRNSLVYYARSVRFFKKPIPGYICFRSIGVVFRNSVTLHIHSESFLTGWQVWLFAVN